MEMIIDTDPGGDDAIAIFWLASLAHQQRISWRAVTTAAGNVGADKTWRNASGLLELCAITKVPVAIGEAVDATRDAAEIHGEDGLGGLAGRLPSALADASPTPSSAVLSDLLARGKPATSLLAVAPLTNLARAEEQTPGILRRTEDLIIMGGALGTGNVTAAAEFNFFFDPQAARTVLAARAGARLVTLETSSKLRLRKETVERITDGFEALAAAQIFVNLCAFMTRRDAMFAGRKTLSGFPMHDAATVAWLAYPDLFEDREITVTVDTEEGPERGRLRESNSTSGSVCRVATRVDADGVMEAMTRDLRLLFETLQTTSA